MVPRKDPAGNAIRTLIDLSRFFRSFFEAACMTRVVSVRVRRYYFALSARGEIVSSFDQSSKNSPRQVQRTDIFSQSKDESKNNISPSRSHHKRTFKPNPDNFSVIHEKSAGNSVLWSETSGYTSFNSSPNQMKLLY